MKRANYANHSRQERGAMTKRAFFRIAAALNEAIGVVRGDEAPARLHPPAERDATSIRKKTGLSRENFLYRARGLRRTLRKGLE